MDNTSFIQNRAKTSFRKTSEKKSINFIAVTVISAIILMTVALISSSMVAGVDAEPIGMSPQDVCLGGGDSNCYCKNDTENLSATCCTTGNANTQCETCQIDTTTGDFVKCEFTKGFPIDNSKTHGNPPTSGALGSQPQNPGNVMTFNPPNNAKKIQQR